MIKQLIQWVGIASVLVVLMSGCGAQSNQVDVTKFEQEMLKSNTVLLDVRTAEEFQSGHLNKAINYDVNASNFEQNIAALDKSSTILVYCRSGSRSAHAANVLRKKGFQVIDLAGGIGAWSAAQKQIVQ